MEDVIQDPYSHKINNNYYFFKVTLVSIAGDQSRAQDIKPSAIKSFVINDNFTNFYQNGYIVINNSYDALERDTYQYDDVNYYNNAGNVTSNQDAGFVFRGDARDILHVEIMPRLDDTGTDITGSKLAQGFFRMSYDFAIYNSEEIPGDSPERKFKKLYFWDLYYQLLTEKNTFFSTALLPGVSGTTTNLDDKNRAVSTGVAIKELLKAAFPDNDGYPIYFSENSAGINITNYTQDQIDNANIDWDIGGTNIFFSSPANYKAIDSLNYLLSRHVSNAASNFDQCFLRLDRYPRQFKLNSLEQYFKQAYNPSNDTTGNYYLETLRLGGLTDADGKSKTDNYFTPKDGLYFERIGTIKSFSFDNMPGVYSQQKINTRAVHSYDYENKLFNIELVRNGVEQAMKTFQANYVNQLNSGGAEPSFPNFAPGQLRYSNKNIHHEFSVVSQDSDQRLAFGRNKFLYASVFSNNLITFRLPGSTHRQAGFFIGIDRDGAIPASKFDNKLLGIYLIIQANHIFSGGEYYNDLHCIKTYNFRQLDNTYNDADNKGLISYGP